jgi:pimeloyl-ACP methyl ester carboxylesterase
LILVATATGAGSWIATTARPSPASCTAALQVTIRQDTLIVAGTDDPIIPVANARIMTALLPHAALHLHPGGHTDLITNAESWPR